MKSAGRPSRLLVLMIVIALIWLGTGSVLTAGSANTIVTLQQGKNLYGGCQDTYITKYPFWANYANDPFLKVGYKQQYAAGIGFNTSAIPSGSTIVSAKLRLYAVGWTPGSTGFQVFAVLRSAEVTQVNWNRAKLGEPWAVPGCNGIDTDRRGTPAGTFAAAGINQWYEVDITALAQEWVNGTVPTSAMLVRGISAYDLAIYYFASANYSIVKYRPQLVVEYF